MTVHSATGCRIPLQLLEDLVDVVCFNRAVVLIDANKLCYLINDEDVEINYDKGNTIIGDANDECGVRLAIACPTGNQEVAGP